MKGSSIFLTMNGFLSGYTIVHTDFELYMKVILWGLLGISILTCIHFTEKEIKNETNNQRHSS